MPSDRPPNTTLTLQNPNPGHETSDARGDEGSRLGHTSGRERCVSQIRRDVQGAERGRETVVRRIIGLGSCARVVRRQIIEWRDCREVHKDPV